MQLKGEILFAVSFLFFTGCYEAELEIKRWAEKESASYFRNLVTIDTEARTAKVGDELTKRLSQIQDRLENLLGELELPPPPQLSPGTDGV